jgi:hypothetical protein
MSLSQGFRHNACQRFDKRGNVHQLRSIMLSIAQYRRGLLRAGNLIAG